MVVEEEDDEAGAGPIEPELLVNMLDFEAVLASHDPDRVWSKALALQNM